MKPIATQQGLQTPAICKHKCLPGSVLLNKSLTGKIMSGITDRIYYIKVGNTYQLGDASKTRGILMDGLKISMVLISAILLLLPGVYGLDFSMGTSNGINGASESIKLNAPLDSSLVSSTEASPESHATSMIFKGSGSYDFEETFDSLDDGEHVRLTAKMADSKRFVHSYDIEKREMDRIRVSQSLDVKQGQFIECSTEAWNSRGQAARVGLKVSSGTLNNYKSYGDATDNEVVADQKATIPGNTRFSVFAEAERDISNQRSMGMMRSSKALEVKTTANAMEKKSKMMSTVSKSKNEDDKDDSDEKE